MSDVLDRLKTVERTTAERFAGAVAVVSRQTIVDAIDEIERLRAIVDRLPKTADGVPIAKGTIIYQAAGAYNMLEHEVSGWQFADDGSLKILMFGRGWTAFCDGWYSTREIAEAARTEVME